MSAQLDDAARATFAALADVLLPAVDDLPAASAIGAHERWLDRALAARPDLAEPLAVLLATAAGRDPAAEARRLHDDEPETFATLALLATGSYYLSPKVRRRIGYPGQKADPGLDDEPEWWLRDGLLDPVEARGPIWRRPPDAP